MTETITSGRRRALLIGIPDPKYDVRRVLRRVRTALVDLGFDPRDILEIPGSRAGEPERPTRRAISCELARIAKTCEANDAWLIYYLGHGGRVRFEGLEPPYADHLFSYLVCAPDAASREAEPLLDVALSERLGRIARRCHGNVTTIIDACHSGRLVRDGHVYAPGRARPAPDWVRAELAKLEAARPWAEPMAYIAAAAPWTLAELVTEGDEEMGALTAALLAVLPRLEPDALPSLDALVHHLRGEVFRRTRGEAQWIGLVGARERRLLSCERLPEARSVSHVIDAGGRSWLRAGALQGVHVGDRWSLGGLQHDAQGRPHRLVEAEVERVDPDRARLRLLDPNATPDSGPAFVRALMQREGVAISGAETAQAVLRECVASSPWLRIDAEPSLARIEVGADHSLVVEGPAAPVRFAAGEHARVVDLLEDRARTRRLLASLAQPSEPGPPIRWAVGRGGADQPFPTQGANVRADDELWIRLDNPASEPRHWYAQVVFVDPLERAWLLDDMQIDGIQLGQNCSEYVGDRPGLGHTISLRWATPSSPSKCALLFIFANRPIQLGHLARVRPQTQPPPGLRGPELHRDRALRSGGMPIRAWSSERFDFTLLPAGWVFEEEP